MKYIIATLMLMTGTLAMAQQKRDTVAIKTSAICEMCKKAIESDLAFEKGVKSSFLDVDSKVLTVIYNPKKTDPTTIRKRVTMVGYNADEFKRDPEAYNDLPECCQDGEHEGDDHDKSHEHHKENNQ